MCVCVNGQVNSIIVLRSMKKQLAETNEAEPIIANRSSEF